MRCIVAKIRFIVKKPTNRAYPLNLKTLGDHLRKTRVDRGLSQSDVAQFLNVKTDSITGWELNRHIPTAKMAKRIIEFIGYNPFKLCSASLGMQLYYARLITGKTQRQVAKIISCDASNLRHIELDRRIPQLKTLEKLQAYIDTVFEDYNYNSIKGVTIKTGGLSKKVE